MSSTKISISKRLGNLAVVGGIPSGAIGLIGDFFTPKGGWAFVLCIGFLVLALSLIVGVVYYIKGDQANETWPFRKLASDPELGWMFDGPSAIGRHILHVGLVFSGVSIFIAAKSFAAVSDGGLIAENFEIAKAAQVSIGLQKEILKEQTKIREQVEKIATASDNFAKETSDDPRKELANLRIDWSTEGLESSIRSGDLHAIGLFIKSGFTPRDRKGVMVDLAIQSRNEELIRAVSGFQIGDLPYSMVSVQNDLGCIEIAHTVMKQGDRLPRTALHLFRKACDSKDVTSKASAEIAGYKSIDRAKREISFNEEWRYKGALLILEKL